VSILLEWTLGVSAGGCQIQTYYPHLAMGWTVQAARSYRMTSPLVCAHGRCACRGATGTNPPRR